MTLQEGQWVSIGGNTHLPPRCPEHLTVSGIIFGCQSWGWAEAKDAARPPTRPRAAPQQTITLPKRSQSCYGETRLLERRREAAGKLRPPSYQPDLD